MPGEAEKQITPGGKPKDASEVIQRGVAQPAKAEAKSTYLANEGIQKDIYYYLRSWGENRSVESLDKQRGANYSPSVPDGFDAGIKNLAQEKGATREAFLKYLAQNLSKGDENDAVLRPYMEQFDHAMGNEQKGAERQGEGEQTYEDIIPTKFLNLSGVGAQTLTGEALALTGSEEFRALERDLIALKQRGGGVPGSKASNGEAYTAEEIEHRVNVALTLFVRGGMDNVGNAIAIVPKGNINEGDEFGIDKRVRQVIDKRVRQNVAEAV